MWYRDALKIGRAEGTIQCTYAAIYDANGKMLFALYRENAQKLAERFGAYGKQSTNDKIIVDTGTFSAEGIIAWEYDKRLQSGEYADTGYIVFDLPLVIADKHSDERLVPVRLDYNAIAYIRRTLASARKKPDGSYNERWMRLAESLSDTATYYVKPAAFDWQPIDVSHMNNGHNPEWVTRKQIAKDRLDRAKAILAVASATMII